MKFPPKDMLGGKVIFTAYQNIYDGGEKTRLIIQVKKSNGAIWEYYVPEPFDTMFEALQYAKQWHLIFRSLR